MDNSKLVKNYLLMVLLSNRSITEVEDYGMDDVKQIVSNDPTNYPFTADPILGFGHLIAPVATQFTVSAKSGGASTISSPSANFVTLVSKLVTLFSTVFLVIMFQHYNSVTNVNASCNISLEAISDVD